MNASTERLQLQEFTLSDTGHIFSLESIPEVVQYQDYPPMTEARAEEYVKGTLENQKIEPRTVIELKVVLKHSQVFIGRVGMMIDYDKLHGNLWYSFLPAMQGRGYAVEAVQALLVLAPKLKSLGIECDPRNQGSRKLAKRLGFEEVRFQERAYESKGEWVGSVEYQKRLDAEP